MPYYIAHLLIALASVFISKWIAAFVPQSEWFLACLIGATIYISREIRDREKLGFWDWKGLFYPVVGCVLLYLLIVNYV